MIEFILRPVQRLPRLKLLVETLRKRTPEDHEDCEQLQAVISILDDCVKRSQPGLQAAESKVKFRSFVDNLVFTSGESIVGRQLIRFRHCADC